MAMTGVWSLVDLDKIRAYGCGIFSESERWNGIGALVLISLEVF